MSHRSQFQKSTMMIEFIVVDIPPLFWTLVNLVRHLVFIMDHVRDDLMPGKGLHIAHLNVRSLLGGHNFDALKHQIRTSGIQIFTISESWLCEYIPDKTIEIEGFNSVRADRTWKDGEGGDMQDPKKGGG